MDSKTKEREWTFILRGGPKDNTIMTWRGADDSVIPEIVFDRGSEHAVWYGPRDSWAADGVIFFEVER